MRQILHTYKLRLTNLSGSNRTLRLGRLSRSRDMDVCELAHLENLSAEQLLERLLAGRDLTLIQKLNPRFEPTNLVDRRLNQIYRQANMLAEETGSYDLQIGYPFVEGRFLDGTICRCPVLLFPVRLLRNFQGRPRWKLEVIKDEAVSFNRTFLLAYEQFQQQRLNPEIWEAEVPPNKDWLTWLNAFYEQIKQFELEVNVNPRLFDRKLQAFPDYKKTALEQFQTGVLTFRPQAVMGIFPQADSALLQDYEVMEAHEADFGLDRIFQPAALPKQAPPTYIKEEDRFFVTPVDHAQETAILQVKQGQSLVVHGPPGTGKSQVIVNMVADALAHGKKVLVVSQKRAALDVVYKRLTALNLHPFAVLVHDYRHDRAAIYRQLKDQIDTIPQYQQTLKDLNLTKWEHDYKRLSRQVDQLNRQFEALYEALTKRRPHGLTVHELYVHSRNPELQALGLPKVGELAKQIDQGQLEMFLDTVKAVRDYQDLYLASHPWYQRLTFRSYQPQDKERIRGYLAHLEAEVQSLIAAYTGLSEQVGPKLLDEQLNAERIQAFRAVDQQVKTASVRAGVNVLASGRTRPDTIQQALDKLARLLTAMEDRKLLTDAHWRHYGSLVKHQQTFASRQLSPLRVLSIPFQRARWFFNKILEPNNLTLNTDSFQTLTQEMKAFEALHKWYTKQHEKAFFADFPLLDEQAEKYAWLALKRLQLDTFRQLKAITYFQAIKPRFVQGVFDMERWAESMRVIEQLGTFNRAYQDILRGWRSFLHPEQVEVLLAMVRDGQVTDWLANLAHTFEQDFADIRDLDRLLFELSTVEKEAMTSIQSAWPPERPEEEWLDRIRLRVYTDWIHQAEAADPILTEVSSRSWPRKEREFIEKLAQRQQRVTELIRRKLAEQLVSIIEYNRLKNPVTFREIYHQVTKKRLIWSIRKLVRETWEKGLQELAPCWLASPESVAAIFPMQAGFFDLVIMDEASQCFVERAIPVILRGKQAVVAGDSQQLPPTNLYQVRYEEAGEDAFVENEIALEVASILDLAKQTFVEARLNWHYRSQAEALINFSNQAFYDGKLQVIPPAATDPLNDPPLSWVGVAGEWRQNRNIPEAERVVELIETLVQRPDHPSIGIVTFNYHQQALIRDLLDQTLETLAQTQPDRYEQLQQAFHQYEGEEFTGLFVKNIENVQGDERDIIIFSIGYAYNERGKLVSNFGLLNQRGGENRLNVAITRARKKIYVVCSFEPGELQVDHAAHDGPRLLRDYLRYVKAISEKRTQDALRLLDVQHANDLTYLPENRLADDTADQLLAQGYEIKRHAGETAYKLDIIARRRGEPHYSLAVECEGTYYFSGRSAKEREIYRRALLEAKGWTYRRIWARNWWLGK